MSADTRTPRLAIIIVSHDDRADLGRCLARLAAEPPATPHQLVVVDNDSRDGTREMLAREWPDVLTIESPANIGFARAVNLGVRGSSGELVLLLNPDTRPAGEAIDRLAHLLDADPTLAAAGPRIVDAEGRPEISWWRHLGPLSELRLRALKRRFERGESGAVARVEWLTSQRREVDWLTGACLMVRRKALLAAGLLDEGYFLYFDDVDLCAALRAGGGRVLFAPEAEIVHLRGRTVDRDRETTARHYRASQLRFYRKHHPGWYPLLALFLRLRGRLPAASSAPSPPGG